MRRVVMRVVSPVVTAAISVSGLVGLGAIAAPSAGADPLQPPRIIDNFEVMDEGSIADPANLFVVSPEMRTAVHAFEDNAVQEVLESRALPASDELLVRSLERSHVRAQMWADLQAIILAPEGTRSPADQLVFDWYLHKLRKTVKGAADFAVDEYLKWSGLDRSQMVGTRPAPKAANDTGWCNYRPPAPYVAEYTSKWFGDPLCFNADPLASAFSFSQTTPSYEQFVKWGLYRELEALGGEARNQFATNNDMAQVLPETAAALSEGVGLVATKSAVPLARALAVPLEKDSKVLTTLLSEFSQRLDVMAERAFLGNAMKALEFAKKANDAAKAAAMAADARAAAATVAQTQEALQLAKEAYDLEKTAFQAASKLAAGAKLFGAVTSVVGAVVDVVVTAVTGSMEIASNLSVPERLDALQEKAASTPDARALLMNRDYNGLMYTTFIKLTTPEAEPDCTGTLLVGDQNRQCANPPGGIPAWDITEPQFLHGFADDNDVVQGWSKTPSISAAFSGGGGSMIVRPHGNGWWVLQQKGADGSVGPERLSMEFDITDWAGNTFRVSRTKRDDGRLVFLLAPIGATAATLTCSPGPGAGAPPAGMAWTSCQRDSLEYVADGGRHAQVLQQTSGDPIIDPYVTLTGPAQVYKNQPVGYAAIANDPYGTDMTYEWSYPCLAAGQPATCTGTDASLVFAFPSTGTYDVTVTVKTKAGGATTVVRPVVVTQPANVISFPQPADMVYTRDVLHAVPYSTQLLSPYATSWLPVTLAVASGSEGVCDVVDSVVTALGVGTCTVVASQGGGEPFPPAVDVTRTFTVVPSPYSVEIADGPMQYSDPAPAPAPHVLAPVAADGVTGELAGCEWLVDITDAAGNVAAPAGRYPLQRCGGLSSTLHTVSYNGYVTVTPEDATLTDTTQQASSPGTAAMSARLVQADDGAPGDLSKAYVDFLLFKSTNTGDQPDVRVTHIQVNEGGFVARSVFGLPADDYRLVIRTSPGSTFTAPPVTGVVHVIPSVAPTITTEPVDVTVKVGGTATFTSAATGKPLPTAQWLRSTDGGATFTEIPGEFEPTLSLANVPLTSNGDLFEVRYTSTAGVVTSRPALLTVLGISPTVTTQPQDVSVPSGGTATFTAAANGVPAPGVHWVRSTNGGVDWEYIPGETSTTLTVANVTLAQSGWQFYAEFSNDFGTAPTDVATLTVTPAAPVVTTQPVDVSVRRGGTATFTAAASGTPTPTVTWQRSRNGGRTWRQVTGATSATLTVKRVDSDMNGDLYRARFVNSQGSATTRAAQLRIVRR